MEETLTNKDQPNQTGESLANNDEGKIANLSFNHESNKKKLKINSITGLSFQIVSLFCGLVLPRLILSHYGSNVNGLINSITSLLGFVTLLEFGVGAVMQAALYKPLAQKNIKRISSIYNEGKRYYLVVGSIFICIILIVSVIYPFVVIDRFDYLYTFILIISISISTLAEYFFGIANSILIISDQKIFITHIVQISIYIINLVVSYLLIFFNLPIQIVKLSTSVVFLIKPFIYFWYVKKHYKLDKNLKSKNELPQKWDGLAQHIAAFVLENTDVFVLTIFASLYDVSIYAIYYMIAKSLTSLIISLSGGNQSFYGNLLASGDIDRLKKSYNKLSFFMVNLSTIGFSAAIILIVPFVLLYTKGVTDANYNQLLFGILLLISQLLYCIRRSQLQLIHAANHFKQTKWSAIIEATINVIVSIAFVNLLGLIGVAIGTIVAMLYRVIYLTFYLTKNIINESWYFYLRQYTITGLTLSASIVACTLLKIKISNFIFWILYALVTTFAMILVNLLLNVLLNKKLTKEVFVHLRRRHVKEQN